MLGGHGIGQERLDADSDSTIGGGSPPQDIGDMSTGWGAKPGRLMPVDIKLSRSDRGSYPHLDDKNDREGLTRWVRRASWAHNLPSCHGRTDFLCRQTLFFIIKELESTGAACRETSSQGVSPEGVGARRVISRLFAP